MWVPVELKNCWCLDIREDKSEEMGSGQRGGCLEVKFFRMPLFVMTMSRLQDIIMEVRTHRWGVGRVMHLMFTSSDVNTGGASKRLLTARSYSHQRWGGSDP